MKSDATTTLPMAGYRIIVIVVGGILLAAAVVKGADLQQFARQIRQYGILPEVTGLAYGVAWFMMVVEAVIGAGLLVNWRPKLMLAAFGTLMLLFIGVLSWAIVQGNVSDCGCFGPAAQRTPAEALVEDIILLLGVAVAWWLKPDKIYFKSRVKTGGVAAVCVLAMVFPLGVDQMGPDSSPALEGKQSPAGMVLESTLGERVDLASGTFLLSLMSTTCNHCMESVPILNEIVAEAEEAITILGVTANDQSEVDRFIEDNFAFYPVLAIDTQQLASLMSDDPLPQYLLIRDGRILSRWQGEVPELATLMHLAEEEKNAS